jgi:hypothetical protein
LPLFEALDVLALFSYYESYCAGNSNYTSSSIF